jgi:hypothetical protein|nr:MAG TPA: tail completion protein [Caudoviricetes sp.]
MISFVKALKAWMEKSGLFQGYDIQLYQWEDKKGGPYVVIQSNGGGSQISTLGSEHYLLVSLIASKAMGFTIEAKAIELINYALSNPVSDFGYIENTGGVPQPIFTTDNRMIMRLQFRIIYTKEE